MSFDNLPGINVQLNDGGLIIPEVGNSESILIIAPSLALDAPDEPVLVRNSSDLITRGFGDFYVNGAINPIASEWKAAVDAGAKTVYLVALKEITLDVATQLEAVAGATYKGVLTGTGEDAVLRRKFVYFYDLLMGKLLDFTVDHIAVKGVTFEDEVDGLAGAFFPEVANNEDYPHIGGIINSAYVLETDGLTYPIAITADTNNKIMLGTKAITLTAKSYDGKSATIQTLAADIQAAMDKVAGLVGSVSVNGAKLSFFLDQAYEVAAGTTAPFMPKGAIAAYVKTPIGIINKGSFAQTVADYCSTKTLMKSNTIGYIGTKSAVDSKVSSVRNHVNALLKLDTEVSPYLQVVSYEVGITLPGTNSIVYLNGATHYAALVSNLRKEDAPTNKEVKGVSAIRYEYSLRQLSQLAGKKIVTFRSKDGRLVVTDGITTAPSLVINGGKYESDYARLSTLRITQLAIAVVREAVDPFIGQPNEMPQYNALNAAIKSALEKIREAGAISGYKFTIRNASERLDKATVSLQIVPAFELRRVDVTVNLAPSVSALSI